MPAPTWAITVDHADPGTPQPNPNTNSTSSTALTRFEAEQDDERGVVVGGASLHALGGEREDDERNAEGADAQVGDGEVEDVTLAAEQPAGERRADGDERCQGDADEHRQPDRLHGDVCRLDRTAGAEAAGDPLGGAVGEEVAAGDDERENGCGERQAAELRRAEPSDDGGVDEHVQRLDGERAERRDGQPEDLAVCAVQALTKPIAS